MNKGKGVGAFTLMELLVVMAVIAILAGITARALSRAHHRAKGVQCIGNFRQWGIALHLYTTSNDDFLPHEGKPTPLETDLRNPAYQAWYVNLPQQMRLPRYADMAWRTNPLIAPGRSIWICPSNPRRCNGSSRTNNLFHYCLNDHLDGTGSEDHSVQLSTIPHSTSAIFLFDSKNLPAVGGTTFVHTNLHNHGAHFLFLDGHAARFKNTDYWDFTHRRAITNNPSLEWFAP